MRDDATYQVVTGPATEPVTSAEAKLYLRVDFTDDDALITTLIAAARQRAEDITGRAFITQTLAVWFDGWPSDGVLRIKRGPVTAVSSIAYYTAASVSTTIGAADYVLIAQPQPARIMPAYGKSWPTDLRSEAAIKITYTAGAATADARYKDLILALIANMYEARDGATFEQTEQMKRIEWSLRMDGY